MGNKKSTIFWWLAGIIITIVFSLPIIFPNYQEYAVNLIGRFPYLAPLVIIVFRFIGVVLAPLPGAPVAFASMAVLPWYEALIWNFIGSESGAIVAFLIARKFREPVVARFAPLEKIHQWQDQVSRRKQFWSFAGFRLVTLVAFDFVSYAAGLTKLPLSTFILVTLLIDIPADFIFFYLGGLAVKYSVLLFAISVPVLLVAVFVFNRFQESKEI